jgi:exopolyphosphatase/guanosine-5'-triphosphate,3'-diphosphate pyrophosphatase
VARNAKKFVDEAEKLLGFPIDVISGNEEARLIYIGASYIAPMCVGKRLVFDIGGGSTEIIIGDGHEPKLLESLPIGCVSFSQRFFSEGIVDEENFKAAQNAALNLSIEKWVGSKRLAPQAQPEQLQNLLRSMA